jgi:peptide deformylase
MVLPVCTWGDPILKRRTKDIVKVTDELRRLAKNMLETLHAENGVGLAANQVGASERLCVIEIQAKAGTADTYFLVNPVITFQSRERETREEGCLSFPGLYGPVDRYCEVEVQAHDLEGKPVVLCGSGLLARAIQHELDHLDGIVFIERMNVVHRVMLNRQLKELAKQTKAMLSGHASSKS